MDSRYKKLEESLKLVYHYPEVYVKDSPPTHWYIPYFGPETQSEKDIEKFVIFGNKVIKHYPETRFMKIESSFKEFKENEKISQPACLVIWNNDIDDIHKRAEIIKDYHENHDNSTCIII